MCDQGKHSYKTAAQAERAITHSQFKGCRVYRHEEHFHITSSSEKAPLHHNTPKGRGPKPFIPSSAKLRRKLENCGRELRAAERAFKRVEELRILAEKSRAAYQEELRAIDALVSRIKFSK